MANILVSDLREDVLDRLDNLVVSRQIPEAMRIKLRATSRVTKAMNQALTLFVRDADLSTISQLLSVATLVADPDIGTAGVSGGIKTYLWPTNAFEERGNGGLNKIILNDVEYEITPTAAFSLESLRYMANSAFYGADYEAFSLDYENKRIYTPENVVAKARIVEYPESINDDDTYGDSAPVANLPLSDTFLQTLSEFAVQELIKMGKTISTRPQAIEDTVETNREGRPPERTQQVAE